MIFIIIILTTIFKADIWLLLLIFLPFSWLSLAQLVRAEFLKIRNLAYVKAARGLGLAEMAIIWRHILPNALVATLTFLPFIFSGNLILLTALDFLGFGLPPGSASLGELLLSLSSFCSLAITLSLLIFIGEGLRDALHDFKQN